MGSPTYTRLAVQNLQALPEKSRERVLGVVQTISQSPQAKPVKSVDVPSGKGFVVVRVPGSPLLRVVLQQMGEATVVHNVFVDRAVKTRTRTPLLTRRRTTSARGNKKTASQKTAKVVSA